MLAEFENAFYSVKRSSASGVDDVYSSSPTEHFLRNNDGKSFVIEVQVRNISEKAGIDAHALIYSPEGLPFLQFDVSVEDGRWNKFSILLKENGEQLAKKLSKEIQDIRSTLTIPKRYLLVSPENI